jgi:small-conductance mechanosensitive channel
VRRRPRRAAATLVGLCLALAAPAFAQLPDAPAPATARAAEAPEAPAQPLPIPGAEVADRAQEEGDRLQRARERTQKDPEVEAIEAQLVASAEEVSVAVAIAHERLDEDASRGDLERASFDFDRLRDRLARWSATLTQSAEILDAELARSAERRAVWEATRARAAADRDPAAVVARIDKTLAEIEGVGRELRNRRDRLLTVREGIAHQQSYVDAMLGAIDSLREKRRRSIFAVDQPPLWVAVAGDKPAHVDLLERMRAERANDLDDLENFARERSGNLTLLALLTAGVILAAIALREPARRLARDDPSSAAPAGVLERPVAAGLVIASILSLVLLPPGPPIVIGIRSIVLLAGTLRLLLPIVDPELRRILYGLTAWYAIDRLRDRMVPDPFGNRLVLFLVAVLALAVFLWLLRPARLAKLGRLARHGAWLRVIGLGMRLGMLFVAVSLVANAIGNTTLAEVLVEGTLAASLLAFIFLAAARVLEGAWALLLRSPLARSLRMVRNHGPLLRERGRILILVALTAWWLYETLGAFDVAEPVLQIIASALTAQWSMGELSLSFGGVLAFAFMIYASVLASRFARFALEEDLLSRASLPRGVPFAISTLVRYAILVMGFTMAVLAAGFEMSRLALVIGALGVGIGIGLQDIVNNVVSGLILLFERPVQVGDVVDVGGTLGEVRRIGIRSSTVRSFEGAELVIPNSKLISETFVNWTLSDRQRRIEIPLGVSYGSDPDRVLELLRGVVDARPELLKQPPPSALFLGFGESALDFLVRAWTPEPDSAQVLRSKIVLDIHRALREAGIEIPFPQRDLHLRTVDPAAGRALAGEAAPEARKPPAALFRPG